MGEEIKNHSLLVCSSPDEGTYSWSSTYWMYLTFKHPRLVDVQDLQFAS